MLFTILLALHCLSDSFSLELFPLLAFQVALCEYCRYTSTELKYFPINTAIYSPHRSLTSVYAAARTNQTSAASEESEEENQKKAEQTSATVTVGTASV